MLGFSYRFSPYKINYLRHQLWGTRITLILSFNEQNNSFGKTNELILINFQYRELCK